MSEDTKMQAIQDTTRSRNGRGRPRVSRQAPRDESVSSTLKRPPNTRYTPTYVPSSHTQSVSSSESDPTTSSKFAISDDLKRELGKHDIIVDKWYHKLLMGQYYNASGMYYYETEHGEACWGEHGNAHRTSSLYSTMEVSNEIPILKKLALEYQRSLTTRNITNMVLIRNELYNHLPEQLWIHHYLTGDVYDAQGKPLNRANPDIETLSKQYVELYRSSVVNCSG